MAVELGEFIGQLRAELTEAMNAGEGADLRFEIGPVELELTVVVDKEAKPGARRSGSGWSKSGLISRPLRVRPNG